MKKHQLVYALVIASSAIALAGAGATTSTVTVQQDKVPSVDTLVVGLEARLAAEPEDPKGWILLARSHDLLGNHSKAWNAYSRARALGTTDSALELKLAANLISEFEK